MKKPIVALVLSLALIVGLGVPVFAEDERELEQDSATEQARELAEQEAERARERAKDQAERLREQAKDEAERLRELAKQRAEQQKEAIEEKREEIKEKAQERKAEVNVERCERNQSKLEDLLPRLSNSATAQTRVLDTMYERVAGFYETGQLTVENYEELVAAIETQKMEAADALSILSASTVELDCDQSGLGSQLSEYRESVAVVRDEVREYRAALVDLIKAMKSAAADSSSDEVEDTEATEVEEGVNNV